jgi:hypothetical protein
VLVLNNPPCLDFPPFVPVGEQRVVGQVGVGQRVAPRRAPAPAPGPPRIRAWQILLATSSNATFPHSVGSTSTACIQTRSIALVCYSLLEQSDAWIL